MTRDAANPLFVVVFTDPSPPTAAEPSGVAAAGRTGGGAGGRSNLVAQLEQELRVVRERLQSATEEHETATEEQGGQ